MPEMDGIETLRQMRTTAPDVGVIMLSSLTVQGGDLTMKALELGAFDFIPKPQNGSMAENTKAVREALIPILKAFTRHREIKSILKGRPETKGADPVPSALFAVAAWLLPTALA